MSTHFHVSGTGITGPLARRASGNYKWWVLITAIFGAFVSILDATVVTTALPHIQLAFGTDLHTASYVVRLSARTRRGDCGVRISRQSLWHQTGVSAFPGVVHVLLSPVWPRLEYRYPHFLPCAPRSRRSSALPALVFTGVRSVP